MANPQIRYDGITESGEKGSVYVGIIENSEGGTSTPTVPGAGSTLTLATGIASVSAQTQINVSPNEKTVLCTLTGTGAISATVFVYGSHTDQNTTGTLLGTLSPSGTTTAIDDILIDTPWPYMWTDTTAISGTSAAHTTTIGF